MQPLTEHDPQLSELERENARLRERLELLERERLQRHSVRRSVAHFAVGVFAGSSLRKSVSRLVDEVYDGWRVDKETIKETTYAILHRITRVGMITLLLATVPLLFAALQTYYLRQQNQKLEYQNRRIEQQTYLQEAERRSSLIFLLDNTLDKMDEELKSSPRERRLSPQLVGRIVALSKALKPYRYLENDSITPRFSSPERGQLLLSLTGSRLHPETYDQLFSSADFSHADLRDVSLEGAYLRKIKLKSATLHEVALQGADLTDADFANASLRQVNAGGARLDHVNFFQAEIDNSSFRGATFRHANFTRSTLRHVVFHEALFQTAKFADVQADTLDFSDARLLGITLTSSLSTPASLSLRLDGAEVDSATLGILRRVQTLGPLPTIQDTPTWLPLRDTAFIDATGRPFVVDTGVWLFRILPKNL